MQRESTRIAFVGAVRLVILPLVMAGLLVVACQQPPILAGGPLPEGTWGGENAGIILDDTVAHVHVGCTYGNFPAPVAVDADGRLSVEGSYLLRAYPIAVGPAVPARLEGVISGERVTFTIAVNDTVQKKMVTLGPATVTLGKEPKMGPCPICRVPRGVN